jgi:hypothetical protein
MKDFRRKRGDDLFHNIFAAGAWLTSGRQESSNCISVPWPLITDLMVVNMSHWPMNQCHFHHSVHDKILLQGAMPGVRRQSTLLKRSTECWSYRATLPRCRNMHVYKRYSSALGAPCRSANFRLHLPLPRPFTNLIHKPMPGG